MRELIRVIDVLPQHYCRYLIEKFERSRPEQTAGAPVDAGYFEGLRAGVRKRPKSGVRG